MVTRHPSALVAFLSVLCLSAPAVAAVGFGQSLEIAPGAPDGGAGPCPAGASGCTVALLRDATGTAAGAPQDGVLVQVRLRARAGSGGSFSPRVLRPHGDGTFSLVGAAGAVTLDGGGGVVSFPTRIAVRSGDVLGLYGADLPPTFGDGDADADLRLFGESVPWTTATGPRLPDTWSGAPGPLLLAGVLEADADGDGFGDETQDACPVDPGRSGRCVVDLGLGVAAPAFGVEGQLFEHAFVVRNSGTSPATGITLRISAVQGGQLRAVTAPGACVDGPEGLSCSVGRVDPGATATVRLTLVGAAGAVVRSAASVSSAVTDSVPGDEAAAAETMLTAASVAPAPRPFAPFACANVVRGTGDDELLSGTSFGDRLIGGAGRDLMRGGGGDDCLEGGPGGDVLDGESGNDRLAGADGHDRLRGGPGNDTLRGGLRNDVLIGGAGNDLLVGGVGKDRFDAGAGNDTIDARDGVRESIDCGRGFDTVRVDRRDRFRGCERVRRR